VRVDGQLVVYAYDDDGRAAHETQPTRRYIFPREQFTRHESESKLGPSYSFWLPWDAIGGQQKNIGLIARFEPHKGPLIVGEQTRHLLPGSRSLANGETAPKTEPIGEIELAQYSKASELQKTTAQNTTEAPSQPPSVTSISLAKGSWQNRLAASRPKPSETTPDVKAQQAPVAPDPAQ